MRLKYAAGADFKSSANVTLAKGYIKKCVNAAIAAGQDPHTLTYYQIQIYIYDKGKTASFYSPEAAEAYCKANYNWCQ